MIEIKNDKGNVSVKYNGDVPTLSAEACSIVGVLYEEFKKDNFGEVFKEVFMDNINTIFKD